MDTYSDLNVTSNTDARFSAMVSQIFFYTYAVSDSLAIFCSLVLFCCFARLPEFRRDPYAHHTVIYLLLGTFLVNTIDTPIFLVYLQNNHHIASMKDPYSFCLFWKIFDFSIYPTNLWFMALFSVERYIMIFFKQIVLRSKKRRVFMYYGFGILMTVFIFCWYICLIRFYPCEQPQPFDFTQILCGSSCYQMEGNAILLNFDWSFNILLPIFLTVLFTLILIVHVVYQKQKISKHLAHQETWKRTRKMFLQLLPIPIVYLMFNIPLISIGLLAISDPYYATTPYYYASSISYFLPMCIPFAILSRQKVVHNRLFQSFRQRRINAIAPTRINDLQIRLAK